LKVVFFHRKSRPTGNYSIESLFAAVRNGLPRDIQWSVKIVSRFSEGLFNRIAITFEAAFSQGDINHITGDINFIALLLRKKRTLLTFHDIGFMNQSSGIAQAVLKWFWIILPVKRCALITTVSQATKTDLLKYVKIDPDRIKVVYVPSSPLFTASASVFNTTTPRILQLGTAPNKNIHRLAAALNGIPCKLIIIGEIGEDLAQTLSENGIVYECMSRLSNEEVVNQYKLADILAFVSTIEGFGMPIIEANAVGRVVVTSNVYSMPEVAGNAAHLVDPHSIGSIREGFLRVISDEVYRQSLIDNGYHNYKRFNVDVIANQYADIYRSMLR